MTALARKQSGNSNVEIPPPPSSELLKAAEAVCEAAAELSKLRALIGSSEQEYRSAKAAVANAQLRHDRYQGVMALAELVAEVNETTSEMKRAESQLIEAQRLLLAAEAKVAERDGVHRALVAELIRPSRAVAADRYRAAAAELRMVRNLYCDIGLILYELDSHALSISLVDIETHTDLLYEPNRKTAPFVAQYQSVRRAIAQGGRR